MPTHNVSPTDTPTREDYDYWREQRRAYLYNSDTRTGIPDDFVPVDAIDWVLWKYREEHVSLYQHDPRSSNYVPLHPKYSWYLAAATMAHFLWFRTEVGERWVNGFFGVQEVLPFYAGYVYHLVDRKRPHVNPKDLGKISTIRLRIHRQWERVATPPCLPGMEGKPDRPYVQMAEMMRGIRSSSRTKADLPTEAIFAAVSQSIMLWFNETQADEGKPFYKRGRVSGHEWVKDQKHPSGKPLYEALARLVAYHRDAYSNRQPGPVRSYKIEFPPEERRPPQWHQADDLAIISKIDNHRRLGNKSEADIEKEFKCNGCRRLRTCVPYTKRDHMCCHCFAEQVEHGSDMPTLDLCTMLPECKGCPDHIDSLTTLINMKQRRNREPRIPVQRP